MERDILATEPKTHCQPMKDQVRGLVVVLATWWVWENAKGWPCWSACTSVNSAVPQLSQWAAFFNRLLAMTVLWGAAEEPTVAVRMWNTSHRVPQVQVLYTWFLCWCLFCALWPQSLASQHTTMWAGLEACWGPLRLLDQTGLRYALRDDLDHSNWCEALASWRWAAPLSVSGLWTASRAGEVSWASCASGTCVSTVLH